MPIESLNFQRFQKDRRAHWDAVARGNEGYTRWAAYYHHRLEQIFQFLIDPGQRVLEIGCGQGHLLAAVRPQSGVGVDFSREMIRDAKRTYPDLGFIQGDGHQLPITGTFDYIILSDLLNDVWDVQSILAEVRRLSTLHTRVIITSYNRLWEPALALADRLDLANPNLYQNWLTVEDIQILLYLADLELIHHWPEILWPLSTPLLAGFSNRFLARFWPFNHLALTHILVARPAPAEPREAENGVSVVIPARNEAGNIPKLFERMPEFELPAELIFVEGHSTDDTYDAIEKAIRTEERWECRLLKQEGNGKGDAVRHGFAHARGDIFVILDADLTVPPEDLPRFIEALISGKAEFANGVRLVYPMQDKAMRFANLVGNKLFSMAFSWLLGQPIKDTLCGTKAMWRIDYDSVARNRGYFGEVDPFGDFDLLLGAAKKRLKILDVPIRYRSRIYGDTNISRWKHGAQLLGMLFTAARKIKFV